MFILPDKVVLISTKHWCVLHGVFETNVNHKYQRITIFIKYVWCHELKKEYVSIESVQIGNVEGKYGLSSNINFIESFARNYPLNDKTNFALDCVMLL